MDQFDLMRSHVEHTLRRMWNSDELAIDDDGDYPYRWGTAMCWVRPINGDDPVVRVTGHAVYSLKPSLKLLTEINDLNVKTRYGSLFLHGGALNVEQTLNWRSLDPKVLRKAVRNVGRMSDDLGVPLAALFGGQTPFPADVSADENAA